MSLGCSISGVVSAAVNSVLGIPDVTTVVVGSSLVKSTDLDVSFVVDSVGSVFNSVDSPLVIPVVPSADSVVILVES